MRIRIGIALLAAMTLGSTTAFAQATLETLMTHSTSTAVTTHAGTALGNAINRAAGNMANQTTITTGRVLTVPQNTAKHTTSAHTQRVQAQAIAAPIAGNGSLIASIQGGEPRSKAQAVKPCDATVAASNVSCAAAAHQATDHPSVVNLPAPQ